MTCRSCKTTPLACTEQASRQVNSRGEVIACRAYKPYKRTITVGLWHTLIIAVSLIFYVFVIGLFVGHEITWKTAEEQQIRDLQAMFKDGLAGGQAFSLPKIGVKFVPRKDGKYNVN